MKYFVGILGLMAILWGAGCSSPSTPPNVTPFTSASVWIYSDDLLDTTGAVLTSTADTIRIETDTTSGQIRTIKLSNGSSMTLTKQGEWTLSTYSENTPTCLTLNLLGTVGDTDYFLKIPVKVDGVVQPSNIVATLRSTNSTAVVTEGVYDCYEFQIEGWVGNFQFLRESYYVSPSLGLVLYEKYLRSKPTESLNLFERKELLSVR